MPELRGEEREFGQAVVAAAAALNVPESVVEKDYWITQILRALRTEYFGRFVMKGGTSLSKGYGLIQRFSEDVDILLVPQAGDADSNRVDELMSAIERSVDSVTGMATRRERAEEGIAIVTVAPYPNVSTTDTATFAREVRIDHGVPGGPFPSESREVRTLLGDGLSAQGVDIREYEDLGAFSVQMLHPSRTLVEKLCVVSSIGQRIAAGNDNVRSREARHFYDIWCLLDETESPALEYLRTKDSVVDIFNDCVQITERFYGVVPHRPEADFATCEVFSDATVLGKIRRSYDRMCRELVFPGSSCPSLDEVAERVRSYSADL